MVTVNDLVDFLDEVNRLEVLVAAEAVRYPFTFSAGVVEIQHRRDRIDPQAVKVEFFEPEQGVRREEIANLVAAVVEYQRSPVRVLSEPGICVLVERGAVEAGQRPVVFREVRDYPVHEDTYASLVQSVHEVAEVVRRAEPRGRRVVPGHLVAPGPTERMLGDWQQFYVRESEIP